MWRLTDYPVERIEADIVVTGLYTKKEMDESSLYLAKRMGSFALGWLQAGRLEIGEGLLMTTPHGWRTPWILWLGLGDSSSFSLETLSVVLGKCSEILEGLKVEMPCFTLLGEGSAYDDVAKLANEIVAKIPYKSGELFHHRREVLYRLFARLPGRFYYRLWSEEGRKRA